MNRSLALQNNAIFLVLYFLRKLTFSLKHVFDFRIKFAVNWSPFNLRLEDLALSFSDYQYFSPNMVTPVFQPFDVHLTHVLDMNSTTLTSWCKGSIDLDEYCIFVSRDNVTIWSMQFSRPMVCDYESLCTDQYFLDYEIHLCYCLPFKYQGNLLFHLEKYQQWIHCLYWKKLGIFVLNKCPFLRLKTMCGHHISIHLY